MALGLSDGVGAIDPIHRRRVAAAGTLRPIAQFSAQPRLSAPRRGAVRAASVEGLLAARTARSPRKNLLSYRMPWDRRFGVPIALLDGRTITTLSDAREVLLTVTPTARRGAVWRYLSTLLIDAAGDRASMIEVEEVLLRGLNSERMI
jgi:hypothetical protein